MINAVHKETHSSLDRYLGEMCGDIKDIKNKKEMEKGIRVREGHRNYKKEKGRKEE
jgi:hypothetical protein